MAQRSYAVLGAGLAGLAAAQALRQAGQKVAIYEKNGYPGGHASTHNLDGFFFDEGPHVSFTKRPEIQKIFAEAVNQQFFHHRASLVNYWHGQPVLHPAQCHLFGLPVDLVERCLIDFVRAQQGRREDVANYAEWLRQSLGSAFSEEFPFRYTRKYWTTEAANMSTDWVSPRIYAPNLEEVIRGALSPQAPIFNYLTEFRYPKKGGFGSYVNAVKADGDLHVRHEVALVDLTRRRLEFSNGKDAFFDVLISSLPLPELIQCIKDVPATVAEAAGKLCCTSVVLVNIGIARREGLPEVHWAYSYDEDLATTRLMFPHMMSPNNAPEGCGGVQVEVYHSPYRALPCKDVLNRVIEELIGLKILRKEDKIMVAREQHLPYANVLFDLRRSANLAIVQGYLAENRIHCCGRYGEWEYFWTDDSVVSGWRAAKEASVEA
jgi:protoporphyrinogen oxidase